MTIKENKYSDVLPLLVSPRRPRENNREYAYRVLRQNIMTMQLLPGRQLSEADLSERLNMSRTPVHEALMMLKNEWLVDVLPQRGSSVSMIRIDYIKEGYFMRLMLETDIMRQLSGHLTHEQLDTFVKSMDAQALVANTGNYEVPGDEFVSLDNDFHQLLYHYGGYDRVWRAMHNVTTHYDRVRYLDNALNNIDEEEILAEHRQFYNYLRIGVPPASVLHEEFERHLGRFRDGFQHLLDMFPGYFQ